MKCSPSRRAVVLRLATSEPALGSVMASAEIFSPAQDRRQHAGLHRLGAEAGDRRRADGVTVEGGGDAAGARARQLLRIDDAIEAVAGDAAVLLRKAQLQQADGGGLLVKLARKLPGLVPLGGVGLDLARNEPAHRLAEGCVLRCVVGRASLCLRFVKHHTTPRSQGRSVRSNRGRALDFPSPLRGGVRGGGNPHGHPLREEAPGTAAICNPRSTTLVSSPHPQPLPIKGRGDLRGTLRETRTRRARGWQNYSAGFSSTSSWRVATWSPGLTARRATRPARLRRHLVLHLHGLDDDEALALGDRVALGHQHGHDLAVHGRAQLRVRSAGRRLPTAGGA